MLCCSAFRVKRGETVGLEELRIPKVVECRHADVF